MMIEMKRLLLTIMLSCIGWGVYAQKEDVYYLLDGTILKGYISEQRMDGDIVISYSEATFSYSKDQVRIRDKETILVSDVVYTPVEVLEFGDIITFKIHKDPMAEYRTSSNNIKCTERSGPEHIVDVIVTRDSTEYRGRIIVTEPGKHTKLQAGDSVFVIRQDNILIQRRESDSSLQAMMNSASLWDVLTFHDGREEKGLLVSQNYTTGELEFLSVDGFRSRYLVSELEKICRLENTLSVNEDVDILSINKKPVEPKVFQKGKDSVCLPAIVSVLEDAQYGIVVIDCTSDYCLFGYDPNIRINKNSYIQITVGEKNTVRYSVEKKSGDVETRKYNLRSGYYLLYSPSKNMGVPIRVY